MIVAVAWVGCARVVLVSRAVAHSVGTGSFALW